MKKLTRRDLLKSAIATAPAFTTVGSLLLPDESLAQMAPFAFLKKSTVTLPPMTSRGVRSGTTSTPELPVGTSAGDLVIICSMAYGYVSLPTQNATPAGWNRIHNLTLSNTRYATYWRIADASISAFNPWGSGGNLFTYVTIAYQNATPTLAAGDIEQEMITGNPAAQTLSTSLATAPVVALGIYGNTSSTTMAGISTTGTWDGATTITNGSTMLLSVRKYLHTSAPANKSIDIGNFSGTDLVFLATAYIGS